MGSHMKRELAGIALLLFAVFLAGALLFQRVPAGGSCMDARGVFGPAFFPEILQCAQCDDRDTRLGQATRDFTIQSRPPAIAR